MATSEQLRNNLNQHKPKNTLSKNDDKAMKEAIDQVINKLNNELDLDKDNYYLKHIREIKVKRLMEMLKEKEASKRDYAELEKESTSTIKPDGGFILLKKKDNPKYEKIVLVAEMKRQGTNDKREAEGKSKQSKGNAIERLGKNLTGIKTALKNEMITPFVCFGWGVDFEKGSSINDRIVVLNEFYQINKTYIYKDDNKKYSPVSMYFRKEKWEVEEIYKIIKEIAEQSIKYYLYS